MSDEPGPAEGAQEVTDPPAISEAANKEPDNKQPEVVPGKTLPEAVDGEDAEEGDDFGQAELNAKKKDENAFRERTGSWADVGEEGDEDEAVEEEEQPRDDEDAASLGGAASSSGGGGMMDLLGRSKAAKEELAAKEAKEAESKKRIRKRVAPSKNKKDKKEAAAKEKVKTEAQKEEEDVWVEPVYNSDDLISKPICNTTLVPNNILKFYESYAYDSGRFDNLQMIDEDTLIFIAGNYLHFYSIRNSEVFLCRRAAEGYGLGHVALHPSRSFFAVGEKGDTPVIVLYLWPSVAVHRILRRGTSKGYAFLNFSPNGEFLCSQGMDPDYMLTIWDYAKERVLLRCKAFANDIYRVTFSPTLAGNLTTCGVGHIRFWKMAETFTGLKLQGAIGRFGKTEISDISGYVELPNGKVLSGCEWGNILVWDGGLIVCEICGLNDETLHKGEITSLIMMNETNEVMTVGKDGYLRIWDVDTLDIADTLVGDTGKYPVEATNEIRLSGDASPLGCIKNLNTPPPPKEPEAPVDADGNPLPAPPAAAANDGPAPPIPSMWYAQDSWGRIWDIDVAQAITDNTYSPKPIFYTPGGGPINCLACSVEHTIMAIGTAGGHLWIIDYITKLVLTRRHYKTAVTKLFWLPQKYDPRGVTFLVAFGDGCIRSYSIQPITEETATDLEEDGDKFRMGQPCEIGLNQVLRFSKSAITVMKFDEENEILYVCGEDKCLWGIYLFYDEEEDSSVMEPLAFFATPFPVYHLDLHPVKPYRMILAGKSSRVAECRRPDWVECNTETTFYQGKLRGRRWWFNSVKSERRKNERREWRKVERERRIKALIEDFKVRAEQGILVEEDIELARLNEEFRKAQIADDEDPIYKPEKASQFLGIYYHINPEIGDPETMAKSFFLHVGDYDAGYIYECKCTRPEVGGFHAVPSTPPFANGVDENDVAIKCSTLSEDDEYLLFGMADGSIRVMPKVDIQQKIKEMLQAELEAAEEEARKNKRASQDDESDFEPDGTTAPQITDDKKKKEEPEKKKGGKKDGLPPFTPSIYPYDLDNFFCLPMHDPNHGAVVEMCWTHDRQFLISVGADGSIFSYRWDPDGFLEFPTDNLPASNIPSESLDCEYLVDEEDPLLQTVEEVKHGEEEEKLRGIQEEFKEDVRAELRDLREVFRSIKQRNRDIPEQFRLTEEELSLPEEIYAELKGKLEEEVDEIFRIHEYESIKNIIQMAKIEKTFFKPLLYPHIVLRDICHKIQTHTIRQKKLSENFYELRDRNVEIMEQEMNQASFDMDESESFLDEEEKPIKRVYAKDIIGEYEHKLDTYNCETKQNIKNLEKRLEERYNREMAWAGLLKKKINKDFIDPSDKARLEYAKKNRGDFQLQTSETYLGEPETVAERRQKVINMKLLIHRSKESYNEKVIEARNEKREILKRCKEIEREINFVQPYIPTELRRRIPPLYGMMQDEEPESEFEITPEQVEYDENTEYQAAGLLEFRDQMNEELFGIMKPEKPLVAEDEIKDFMAPSVRNTKSIDLDFENMSVHKYRKYLFQFKKDNLKDQTRYETTVWPKMIEQELLFNELNEIIDYFHNRVKYLHDLKIKTDIDLHIKMIGFMTLIRELDIAKEFDTQENGILERLRVQKQEFHDSRNKLDKAKKKVTKMNADVKKYEGELMVIQKEVQNIITASGKWAGYLEKVFKKKVKLESLEAPPEGEEGEIRRKQSSSESSDNSESTSQDTNSDLYILPKIKLDVNECPEHLDKTIYNKVGDFRMKKALTEVQVENAKKAVEKVQDDYVAIERVYKMLEGRLTDTGQDIRVLQRRRQKRLNELKCMLIMRVDQINCVDMDEVGTVKGDLFQKLVRCFPSENKILVFPKGQTDRLMDRSDELHVMKEQEIQRMRNGRQMHLRLTEELKKSEKKVEDLKVKVKEDMIFKFGKEIDLDKICAAIINLQLLDKEIELDKLRKLHYVQRHRIIDAILDAKDDFTAEIRENSNLKILESMILERKRDLDYFLYKTEKDKEKVEIRAASRKQSERKSVPGGVRLSQENKRESNFFQQAPIFTPVDEQVEELKRKVREYELKANALREAMRICKRKSGLPPILPLQNAKCGPDAGATYKKRMGGKLPQIKVREDRLVCDLNGSPKMYRVPAKQREEMNKCPPMPDPRLICPVKKRSTPRESSKSDEELDALIASARARSGRINQPPASPTTEEEDEYENEYGPERGAEFGGEGDPSVRYFEEQFGEYLKNEREEVMEYLGEVDDAVFANYPFDNKNFTDLEEEESDWTVEEEETAEQAGGIDESLQLTAGEELELEESTVVTEINRKVTKSQMEEEEAADGEGTEE